MEGAMNASPPCFRTRTPISSARRDSSDRMRRPAKPIPDCSRARYTDGDAHNHATDRDWHVDWRGFCADAAAGSGEGDGPFHDALRTLYGRVGLRRDGGNRREANAV